MNPLLAIEEPQESKSLKYYNRTALASNIICILINAFIGVYTEIYVSFYVFTIILACINVFYILAKKPYNLILLKFRWFSVYPWSTITFLLAAAVIIVILVDNLMKEDGAYAWEFIFALVAIIHEVSFTWTIIAHEIIHRKELSPENDSGSLPSYTRKGTVQNEDS